MAGPLEGGKSTAFALGEFGVDHFNVDDRAAKLNKGNYRNIPPEIRAQVQKECEQFIADHIREKKSFAVETTLRSDITFEQAAWARTKGFSVELTYVATDDVEDNVERVAMRADGGGHSAPPERLRHIYEMSLRNFPRALREFDRVEAFDNTERSARPRLVLTTQRGRINHIAEYLPSWLERSLMGTEYELES